MTQLYIGLANGCAITDWFSSDSTKPSHATWASRIQSCSSPHIYIGLGVGKQLHHQNTTWEYKQLKGRCHGTAHWTSNAAVSHFILSDRCALVVWTVYLLLLKQRQKYPLWESWNELLFYEKHAFEKWMNYIFIVSQLLCMLRLHKHKMQWIPAYSHCRSSDVYLLRPPLIPAWNYRPTHLETAVWAILDTQTTWLYLRKTWMVFDFIPYDSWVIVICVTPHSTRTDAPWDFLAL